MNTRQCQALAERMDKLLQPALGCGVQPQRMLADPLYARDVLLVCDAHPGTELATLARDYRAAQAEGETAVSPRARASSARTPSPGVARRPAISARGAAPASLPPPLTRPPRLERTPAQDSGLSSFFDRFRPSGPASLSARRGASRPMTLGLDGPDTWPPESDVPLAEALEAPAPGPLPADRHPAGREPNSRPGDRPAPQGRRAWFSPARWFDRNAR